MLEQIEIDDRNRLKVVSGICNSRGEALEYQGKLGKGHGVVIEVLKENPVIEIRELTPGAIGLCLFRDMNQILIDRSQRQIPEDSHAQMPDILDSSVSSIVQDGAMVVSSGEGSYLSRLLSHVATFFKHSG